MEEILNINDLKDFRKYKIFKNLFISSFAFIVVQVLARIIAGFFISEIVNHYFDHSKENIIALYNWSFLILAVLEIIFFVLFLVYRRRVKRLNLSVEKIVYKPSKIFAIYFSLAVIFIIGLLGYSIYYANFPNKYNPNEYTLQAYGIGSNKTCNIKIFIDNVYLDDLIYGNLSKKFEKSSSWFVIKAINNNNEVTSEFIVDKKSPGYSNIIDVACPGENDRDIHFMYSHLL